MLIELLYVLGIAILVMIASLWFIAGLYISIKIDKYVFKYGMNGWLIVLFTSLGFISLIIGGLFIIIYIRITKRTKK